ncbi:unnamed protein product [Prorocentrum cordatum]|nr:unnamed protein product [Polarella glacialis]CAK0792651.1 unnamed protein product [Polarella glacialis]|mmetsp:Transcript_82951/g.234664  ORF Transcript_82951/g.234664 Transcript_82951/m.234664 type:complete len:269 (-) Transcript_82951:77-883(-)
MVFGIGGNHSKYEALNPSGQPVELDMPSAMTTLSGKDEILVKQRMSKLETLFSFWEAKNKYDIYSGRSRIFYAEEKTGCCMRQFQNTCPDCAPFEVDVDMVGYISNTSKVFHYKKDCSLVCCCFCRPVVQVFDEHGNKIGSIRDPMAICPTNMTFDVRDHQDNHLLHAESGVCQWGLCCPFPVGPCKSVDFPLKDGDGNIVGMMQKRMKGLFKMCFCSWCFEDVENYKIEFKKVEDARTKALIMALAIFTDFRYFSNTGDDDKDKDDE